MSFDLRALVRQELSDSDEADPGVIADRVVDAIPEPEYVDALRQVMRMYVRQVISTTRVIPKQQQASMTTSSRPTPPPRPIPSTSWKGKGIREAWQRHLRDRVHVGESQWKLLSDCSYDDLLAAAAERQAFADRNAAWARTYRAYATAVSEEGVKMFGDLPTGTLMHLLGGTS